MASDLKSNLVMMTPQRRPHVKLMGNPATHHPFVPPAPRSAAVAGAWRRPRGIRLATCPRPRQRHENCDRRSALGIPSSSLRLSLPAASVAAQSSSVAPSFVAGRRRVCVGAVRCPPAPRLANVPVDRVSTDRNGSKTGTQRIGT